MRNLIAVLALLVATSAWGQQPKRFSLTANSQCAVIGAQNNSTVGIIVSGTWVGTLTPTLQIAGITGAPTAASTVTPSNTTTPQGTITGNGGFRTSVGGFTQFNLCFTAFTSGTAIIDLFSTQAVNAGLLGGGGSTTGFVTADGTPVANQMAQWTSATSIQGITNVPIGAGTGASLALTGAFGSSGAGLASLANLYFNGALFTGGSGTTTFPYFYYDVGASKPTSFSTSGTMLGMNMASGFAGNFIDVHVNGGSSVFTVGSTGSGFFASNLSSSATVTGLNYAASNAGSHFRTAAATTDISGTIAISSATSAAKTFATAYTNAPNCVITPTSDPTTTGTWWVTTSTTAVTANVSISGTISFKYICVAATT